MCSCRPNQIFAISLDYPILDRDRWETVVQTVSQRLLTPLGWGTLAPGDGVETFGTEYLDRMVRRCSDWLDREGDSESAHKIRSCIKQRTTGAHT